MAPSPGTAFERSLVDSLPKSPLIYARKSPTPPRPAPVRELIADGRRMREQMRAAAATLRQMVEMVRNAGMGMEGDEWVSWLNSQWNLRVSLDTWSAEPAWIADAERLGPSFTPGAGVDLVVTAPAKRTPERVTIDGLPNQPSISGLVEGCPVIAFAIEAKSVSVPRLDHSSVRQEQLRVLRLARAAGHVAGIAIEFRGGAEPECWFILVDEWDRNVSGTNRKSLSLNSAREIGVQIHRDPARGRKATYWKMDEFIRRFGGEV